MKYLFTFYFLLLPFFTGCLSAREIQGLSVEQIDAYSRTNHRTLACLTVGGPPAVGQGVLMVFPANAAGTITFTADCHPNGSVTVGLIPETK